MNHVRELTSRLRAFTRHNLSSFTTGGTNNNNNHATTTDEEAGQEEGRERSFTGRYDCGIPRLLYNAMDQALGSFFPVVFFLLIMLGLFFSAVILTAITGDGKRIHNVTTSSSSPNTNSATTITDPDPTSTSTASTGNGNVIASFPVDGAVAVHPVEGNRFAAISIFLAMSVFSILTTLLAYRLLVRARLAAAAGGSDGGISQLRMSNSMVRVMDDPCPMPSLITVREAVCRFSKRVGHNSFLAHSKPVIISPSVRGSYSNDHISILNMFTFLSLIRTSLLPFPLLLHHCLIALCYGSLVYL